MWLHMEFNVFLLARPVFKGPFLTCQRHLTFPCDLGQVTLRTPPRLGMMQQTLCHQLSMELQAGGAAAWDGGSKCSFAMGCDRKSWQLILGSCVVDIFVVYCHGSIPHSSHMAQSQDTTYFAPDQTKSKWLGVWVRSRHLPCFLFSPFFDLFWIGYYDAESWICCVSLSFFWTSKVQGL